MYNDFSILQELRAVITHETTSLRWDSTEAVCWGISSGFVAQLVVLLTSSQQQIEPVEFDH